MDNYSFVVTTDSTGQRIDKYLCEHIENITRNALAGHIEKGNITVNNKVVSKNYKLKAGDAIDVIIPDPVEYEAKAENIPLDIVYEDSDLLVVNKPKGMVVHPAAGHFEGTLVNALLYHCKGELSGINGVMRPGIVHRIDKNTSGLLLVAKNDKSHNALAEQIKEHSLTREYEAVVIGNFKEDSGVVDAPIGRHHTDRKKMTVTEKYSKNAVTHFEVLERFGSYTHIKCVLETGRTHQIRVHMAYLGHPVSGDDVYGSKKEKVSFTGQCLHAKKIGFLHPTTGEYMEFSSELPEYFEKFLKKLRNTNN